MGCFAGACRAHLLVRAQRAGVPRSAAAVLLDNPRRHTVSHLAMVPRAITEGSKRWRPATRGPAGHRTYFVRMTVREKPPGTLTARVVMRPPPIAPGPTPKRR